MKRLASERASAEKILNSPPSKRVNMPKKNQHRMHAHINPFQTLNMPYPHNIKYVDWSIHYPSHFGIPNNNDNKIVVNTNLHPISYDQ